MTVPDMSENTIIACSVASAAAVGQSARVATRTNFSYPLLAGAARLARQAQVVELATPGNEFGPQFEELLQCVPAAVMLSVSALESYINELAADRHEHWGKRHEAGLLDALWSDDDRRDRPADKFARAWRCSGLAVNRGAPQWQALDDLVALRNHVVHFRPEWDDEGAAHERLSQRLRQRFTGSRFLPETERLFPRRFASHSCAEWAVKAVLDILVEFEKRSGIRPIVTSLVPSLATRA
jgi:hypothetical protein